MNQFKFKSAVIVCHDAMFGPPHELRDYLLSHGIQRLLFIGHSNKMLADNDIKSSYFELYVNGKMIQRYVSPVLRLPELMGYIKDSIVTLYWVITKTRGRINYFIGLGNLNAYAGLLLKKFGLVKLVYYYVIDYIPNRFPNKVVNLLYHWIDKTCAHHADTTWNYAKRMVIEREKRWKGTYGKQIVVPNGIHIRADVIRSFFSVKKTTLVYLGTLREEQGIHEVIQAIPLIRQSIRNIHLTIIGKGEYRNTLIRLVADLHIQKHVTFVGYIEDPVKTDRYIAPAALGVATYNPRTSFIVYSEPGKVKRYLSCGVPVLMTDVTPLGKEIEKNKCGVLCMYDPDDIAQKVIGFMKDPKKMMNYRSNAVIYASRYEWERVFTDAFLEST